MVKWKIGLGIYCALVIYVSSMSPGELPRAGVAVSDKVIHLVEYAVSYTHLTLPTNRCV